MTEVAQHDRRRPGGRRAGRAWLVLLTLFVGLAVGLGAIYVLAVSFRPDTIFNSDLLEPFLVAHDVLTDPPTAFTWYHSAAFYLVPDIVLAAILAILPIPLLAEPLVYCGVLLALYCMATGWLFRLSGVASAVGGAVALSLIIGGTYALLYAVRRAGVAPDVGTDMVMFLGVPFIHTGATVLGIAFIASTLSLRMAPSRGNLWRTIALAAAGSYSDLIFALWFVLPVLTGHLVMSGRGTLRIRHALMVAGAAVVAVVADHTLRPTGITVPSDIGVAVQVWWDGLLSAIRDGSLTFPSTVAMTIVMAARSVFLIARRRREPSIWNLAEVSLCLAQVAALALPVASGSLVVIYNLRYALAAFLLPLIWLAGTVLALMPTRPRRLLPWGAACGWIGLSLLFPTAVRAASGVMAPTPMDSCLLANQMTTGIGDYWNAKRGILQTDYRVHIVQVLADGSPYRYNTNDRWFTERPLTREAIAPNFIVTTRLDPEALRHRFGEPARMMDCGGEEVWLYDRNLLPDLG